MPLIDPSRVLNNLIVFGILLWIGFLIYSKMDKAKVYSAIESLKKMFGNKEE